MAFRLNAFEADETNVNRLWDLYANRTNHLKQLETIYKERQAVRVKSQKDHLKRKQELQKLQVQKLKDYDHRNRALQNKINYENALLRNKILQVYQNGSAKRKSRSLFINQMEKTSPFKMNQAEQMYRTNLKIGERLSNIKSQVGALCNIEEHSKKSQMLLEMLQKKSPKKKAYLKSLTRKKFFPSNIADQFSEDGIYFLK